MPLFRLFGLALLLQASIWSATPIHQEVAESPLMYLRLPVLWDRDELNPSQKEQLTTALLQSTTESGKAGYAQRQVLSMLRDLVEIMALPPENKFLPMPGLALRSNFKGSQDDMAKRIQSLIIAMVEEFQGSPADWLKFKRKVENGVITDSAFLLGRITLITEKDRFTLMFSQSNPNFPEKFKAKAANNIEANQGSQMNDFSMYVDIGLGYSFYKDWLKRIAQPVLLSLTQAGLVDLKVMKFWSEGSGQNFSFKGSIALSDNNAAKWNMLSSAKKAKVQYPDVGDFKGSMLWPTLTASQWLSCFEVLSFIPPGDRMNYAQLFEKLSGSVAFSWRETSIAPIISVGLKDVKSFEAALSKMIAPTGKIAKESGSNLRHIMWEKNSVSYRIEGSQLTFSPLLQSLRDLKSTGQTSEQSELIKVTYPLSGSLSGNYYTLMHLVLQTIVNSNASLDPKVFPSFNNLNVSERSWTGRGSFELTRNKQNLEMVWNQPFGLPGLVSGVKLPSSSWVYFLSLASLTSNSINFSYE